MPPHVYVTVWEDLHNSAQKYMQRKKAGLLFWLYCCCSRRRRVLETLCVIVKEKLLCLGSKRGINQWLSYIYNTVPEHFNPNIVCAAQFAQDCVLNLEEYPTMLLYSKTFYKVD